MVQLSDGMSIFIAHLLHDIEIDKIPFIYNSKIAGVIQW